MSGPPIPIRPLPVADVAGELRAALQHHYRVIADGLAEAPDAMMLAQAAETQRVFEAQLAGMRAAVAEDENAPLIVSMTRVVDAARAAASPRYAAEVRASGLGDVVQTFSSTMQAKLTAPKGKGKGRPVTRLVDRRSPGLTTAEAYRTIELVPPERRIALLEAALRLLSHPAADGGLAWTQKADARDSDGHQLYDARDPRARSWGVPAVLLAADHEATGEECHAAARALAACSDLALHCGCADDLDSPNGPDPKDAPYTCALLETLTAWNDADDRTHADVVAAITDAIATLRASGA